jgi:hypothetical protein
MPSYSPELIQIMRAALDEVMTKIPLEQATPGVKAALAECILKAAANGQTSYYQDSLCATYPQLDVRSCTSLIRLAFWGVDAGIRQDIVSQYLW